LPRFRIEERYVHAAAPAQASEFFPSHPMHHPDKEISGVMVPGKTRRPASRSRSVAFRGWRQILKNKKPGESSPGFY
jgi:hypothetical protein